LTQTFFFSLNQEEKKRHEKDNRKGFSLILNLVHKSVTGNARHIRVFFKMNH